MAKVLDCGHEITEDEIKSCYYVHFQTIILGKGMKPLFLPAMI